jgi:hypothetical protein
VWFTDRGTTSEIGRVTPSGQITYFSVNLHTGSQLWYLAPGPDGNVWFTDRGTTGAIGRITPSGAIQEFNLGAGDAPLGIAPGPDGNVWFTDTGGHAIGRVTPSGQITEFSSNLLSSSYTWSIAPGADGNLWFTDDGTGAIWRVGAGAPAAEAAVPIVSGSGQAGSVQTCVAGPWATWAGFAPSTGLFPFDGYTWLRDGAVVGGQSGQNYVPAAGDVGHQLACEVRATYPAPFLVTAQTTSAPVVVHGASSPSPVAVLPPIARLGASSSLGATASIPFTCSGTPGQVCREGVVGTSRERKQRHSIIAVVASRESERAGDRALRTVTVTVVSASFSLAAGGAALEQVTLNDVGKQLLARFHTLPVRLTFAGAVTAVEDVVFSRALPRIRVSLPPDDWFHTFAPCGDCYSYAMHVPVTGLTPTMRISVSCAGQGCPFSRRNVTPRTRTVDIARVLANSHLLPGTKVSVAITARGRTGEAVTYTMQKGSGPVRTILCLAGGSDRPLPCGS